ncbi:uncharacterized protein C3orf20 homolog [Tachyglossus aculeatus]|uniref:uncharacterized protein C3orf20 homolog n=1 Tax=Tachyglossus aculeatus TaxID=9261 RepID=UPI0018F47F67|nr:uncharacterized protein C3orf20 homolog [Tachyglossus aculeatus]
MTESPVEIGRQVSGGRGRAEEIQTLKVVFSQAGKPMKYYPSGHLAICQSYSNLPAGGVYTNIFSDSLDRDVLGTFTPFGCGSVSFPRSQIIAMMFNRWGGVLTSRRGETVREWKWPRVGKLDDPVFIQVNKYITVKIAGRFAVDLFYKWQEVSLKLSLAPAQDSAAPCFEVDQVVSSVKFIPKSVKEVHKLNRKKLTEKEAKKPTNKESSDHSVLVKTERPEVYGSLANDCSAIRELRKLQKKIRNIVDDWSRYYRLAFGIGSPQISRMPDVPQGILRKRKVQTVRALPPAPMVQNEEEKIGDTEVPETGNSLRQPMDCFQPASARNMSMETSTRSHSLRVSSLTKSSTKPDHLTMPQTTITKSTSQFQSSWISGLPLSYDNEKFWFTSHLTCPVVLRRTLRGEAGKTCKCSNQQIPYVTDLEYDHIIHNQMSSPEQITVICLLAPFQTEEDVMEDEVEELYRRKNKTRNMPCMQSRLDSFRLLKYIIYPADEFRGQKGSLLVQRHNAAPGMFLMYIQGRLLFANYIFNGYSTSAKDLQKQIVKSRSDYKTGFCLPDDFRFSSHADDFTLASS